jgi:hypothetical protein
MASTNETGHAKNVANFDDMISYIHGYETTYNPSKPSIKLDALQTLSTDAKNVSDRVNSALGAYKNAIAARDSVFSLLSKLVTRALNALKATSSTSQVDESASAFVRKIHGRRASAKKTEEEKKADAAAGKETVQISASQMSFDSQLDNFDKFLKLLSGVDVYTPNEDDLKISSLTSFYNDLKAKNNTVATAAVSLSNARIARNEILYKDITGLVDVTCDVKTYVKSVFGATSPQFKQISRLKFTRHQ